MTAKSRSFFKHLLWRRCGGFTLLEVLIVVVISVMVTAFAVPSFRRAQNKNKNLAATGVLLDLGNAVRMMRVAFPGLDFSGQVTSSHMTIPTQACIDNPSSSCAINYMFYQKYLTTIPLTGNTVKGYAVYVCGRGGGGGSCCAAGRAASMQNTVNDDQYPSSKCAWLDNSGILGNNY